MNIIIAFLLAAEHLVGGGGVVEIQAEAAMHLSGVNPRDPMAIDSKTERG